MSNRHRLSTFRPLHCQLVVLLGIGLSVISPALALSAATSTAPAGKNSYSGAYCGLYCLYVALKLTDANVEFANLTRPQYVGSTKGSSIAELTKAATDLGAHAVPIVGLTCSALRACGYPMILHVKRDIAAKEFDHYELFLGVRDDQALLFDADTGPPRLVAFQELAARWDGMGLVVAKEPVDTAPLFAPARRHFWLGAILSITVIVAIRRFGPVLVPLAGRTPVRTFGFSGCTQMAGLCLAALFTGVGYHLVQAEGFLAHPGATTPVEQAHCAKFIPKISVDAARRMAQRGAVILDARYTSDFEKGHLPEAISVAVNLNEQQRRQIVDRIPRESQVVVYCQSKGCTFADDVAATLSRDGFANLSIFRGGWTAWNTVASNQE